MAGRRRPGCPPRILRGEFPPYPRLGLLLNAAQEQSVTPAPTRRDTGAVHVQTVPAAATPEPHGPRAARRPRPCAGVAVNLDDLRPAEVSPLTRTRPVVLRVILRRRIRGYLDADRGRRRLWRKVKRRSRHQDAARCLPPGRSSSPPRTLPDGDPPPSPPEARPAVMIGTLPVHPSSGTIPPAGPPSAVSPRRPRAACRP
jgi:hypothetical protein